MRDRRENWTYYVGSIMLVELMIFDKSSTQIK